MNAYTPEADHSITPNSVTPTRHDPNRQERHDHIQSQQPQSISPYGQTMVSDYAQQPVYYNEDTYTPSENASYYDSSGSSSLNIPHTAVMEDFGFYTEFADNGATDDRDSSMGYGESQEGQAIMDNDRTPVVSDTQRHINPQSFPAPPGLEHRQPMRGASDFGPQMLMSPFQHFNVALNPQAVHSAPYSAPLPYQPVFYSPSNEHNLYDPSIYQNGQQAPMQYPLQGYTPAQIPEHALPAQPYAQPYPQLAPAQPAGVAESNRSLNGSPTSSATSSAVSLARSASTSSEMRPARPKVKLSKEDKRNIVELHRSNSSLRQEDVARIYGVDRSTISKICLNPERWTGTEEISEPAAPRQTKSVGGRFPAIEASMDIWFDDQIARGTDIRDSAARDKAKEMAQEMGYPADRFKASAKWLDKFKERRRLAGKPNSISNHPSFGYYSYGQPYPSMGGLPQPVGLARSQSAITLSSSDSSSQSMYMPSPHQQPIPHTAIPHQSHFYQPEPHTAHGESMPSVRQRSNSTPHIVGEPGQQDPSSGKTLRSVRPVPLNRQNSYHGSSPSPRRPAPLLRASTSQSGIIRRNRPTSLAASAFGITPINADLPTSGSPLTSPASAQGGLHSRLPSETSLAPFTSSMSVMSISPTISDAADTAMSGNQPVTPMTPANASISNVMAVADYNDTSSAIEFNTSHRNVHQGTSTNNHYAPVPHKHYEMQHQMQPQYDLVPIPEPAHDSTSWR